MFSASTLICTTRGNATEAQAVVDSTANWLTASLSSSGSTTPWHDKDRVDGSWKVEPAGRICALVAHQCQSELSHAVAPFCVECQFLSASVAPWAEGLQVC